MRTVVSLGLISLALGQFNMPSMPSMPSMGGSGSGSLGNQITNQVNNELQAMQNAFQCIQSSCGSQESACGADSDCNTANKCVQGCIQSYNQNKNFDLSNCEWNCASDLIDNQPFQNLATCSNNCMIKEGVMGFDCLQNQCAQQWNAFQSSPDFDYEVSCVNTCFGDGECLQDCANASTDQTLKSVIQCQVQCIYNEVPKM